MLCTDISDPDACWLFLVRRLLFVCLFFFLFPVVWTPGSSWIWPPKKKKKTTQVLRRSYFPRGGRRCEGRNRSLLQHRWHWDTHIGKTLCYNLCPTPHPPPPQSSSCTSGSMQTLFIFYFCIDVCADSWPINKQTAWSFFSPGLNQQVDLYMFVLYSDHQPVLFCFDFLKLNWNSNSSQLKSDPATNSCCFCFFFMLNLKVCEWKRQKTKSRRFIVNFPVLTFFSLFNKLQ